MGKKVLYGNYYVAYNNEVAFERRAKESIIYKNCTVDVAHLKYIVLLNVYDYQKRASSNHAILLLDNNQISKKGLHAVNRLGKELSRYDGKSFEIRKLTKGTGNSGNSDVLMYAIKHNLRHFETLDASYDIYRVYKCKYVKKKPVKLSQLNLGHSKPVQINTNSPSLNNNPDVSGKVEYRSLSFDEHEGYFFPDYHSRKGID